MNWGNKVLKPDFFDSFARLCFYLFFAFLPFRIGIFLFPPEVFSSGFLNHYSGYFLYLADVFLIVGVLGFLIGRIFGGFDLRERFSKFRKDYVLAAFIVFVFFILFSVFFSVDVLNTFFYFVRFVQLIVVYLFLVSGFLDFRRVAGVFVGVLFLQSLIVILQFYLQSSLGLKFLGEPILNVADKGLASFDFGGEKVLRPYGTFPHPNVLGMYFVFGFWFFVFISDKIKDKLVSVSLIFLFLSALLLSFSRSAWLVFFVSSIFYFIFKYAKSYLKYGVCFVFFALIAWFFWGSLAEVNFGDAILERFKFIEISLKMFFDNPFGVGMGNFTSVMQNYDVAKLFPWNYQPVHNIFLLSFAETGFLGGVALLVLFFSFFKKAFASKLFLPVVLGVCVLIAGFFDHYFLTLFQGQVLLILFLSLNSIRLKRT